MIEPKFFQSVVQGIVNLTIEGQIEAAWPSSLCAHHVLPNLERLPTEEPIVDRLHQVAA